MFVPAKVPDQVRNFIVDLHKAIIDRNVYEIQNFYENGFNKITEAYFKHTPWPDENQVKGIINFTDDVQSDINFIILYKDLYFRHVYARCQNITTDQRLKSFFNYCELFNYILRTDQPVSLDLPNQWLWDIIDEFIYQFQSFTFFKAKQLSDPSKALSPEDLENINKPSIWNVHAVLNVLYSLVEKSNINEQLKEFNNGRNPDEVAGEFGRHIFYKMLGYFSLIGLLRLHSILGDHYLAIKVLENIDLNRQQLQSMAISRVLACQVTTFYYVGFAYMMMRRYSDAIRTYSNILVYLQRTKPIYNYRTFQIELIEKQTDQIYKLLAICLALHPQRIDESILSQLNEKMHDSYIKLQSGEIKEFENIFRQACPKIISFMPGNKSYKHHITIFLEEVEQQHKLLEIRSFLKFYTTMPIAKLAEFLEIDSKVFNRYLLCFKHKMQNFAATKQVDNTAKALENEFQSGSDVDFYIDKVYIFKLTFDMRYSIFFMPLITGHDSHC